MQGGGIPKSLGETGREHGREKFGLPRPLLNNLAPQGRIVSHFGAHLSLLCQGAEAFLSDMGKYAVHM